MPKKIQQPKAQKESRIKNAFIMILTAILNFFADVGEMAYNFFQSEKTRDTLITIRQIIIKGILLIALIIVVGFLGIKLLGVLFVGVSYFWSLHGDKIVVALMVVGIVYWWVSTSKKAEPPPPEPDLTNQAYLEKLGEADHEMLIDFMYQMIRSLPSAAGIDCPDTGADIVPATVKGRVKVINKDYTLLYYVIDRIGDCNKNYIMKMARERIRQHLSTGSLRLDPVSWEGHSYAAITLVDVHVDELFVRFHIAMTTPYVLAQMKGRGIYELEVDAINRF